MDCGWRQLGAEGWGVWQIDACLEKGGGGSGLMGGAEERWRDCTNQKF